MNFENSVKQSKILRMLLNGVEVTDVDFADPYAFSEPCLVLYFKTIYPFKVKLGCDYYFTLDGDYFVTLSYDNEWGEYIIYLHFGELGNCEPIGIISEVL